MKQDKRLLVILIGALVAMILTLCGCQEQHEVWGTGQIPGDDPVVVEVKTEWEQWVAFFGDGNMSRLNFVQTQRINGIGQLLAEANVRMEKLEAAKPTKPNVVLWQDEGLIGGRLVGYCDDGSVVWKDKDATKEREIPEDD